MPNFHYRVERVPEREAAPREASDDLGDAEVRARWSRTAGATLERRTRRTYPSFVSCLGQRRVPRDKTKPGPCSLSSFIRGRGEQFLRSVWTGPFIPPNFQPRRVYGRPNQFPTPCLPPGAWRFQTTTWIRHPRHPRPNARGSGLPEYFIYSPPGFFLFASLSLIALPFSLSLHLVCRFFTSRLRLSIDALLLLRF